MKVISIQEAYRRKFERQQKLSAFSCKYKLDISGHCAHIGNISRGCVSCFINSPAWSVRLGAGTSHPSLCQCRCPYCFESDIQWYKDQQLVLDKWELPDDMKRVIISYFLKCENLFDFTVYSFTGSEGLHYMQVVREFMKIFRGDVDKMLGTSGWAKIYTNGLLLTRDNILKLKDFGVDEVRVHLGATNFSEAVYKNMEEAARHLPVITVETPAWPPHRKKLFEMLPIIKDIGVKHLNIDQVEIDNNIKTIDRLIPDSEIYQTYRYFLDDGGLVEDLMREVIIKGYPYSVIDCNAFVHQKLDSKALLKDSLFFHQSQVGEKLVNSLSDANPPGDMDKA